MHRASDGDSEGLRKVEIGILFQVAAVPKDTATPIGAHAPGGMMRFLGSPPSPGLSLHHRFSMGVEKVVERLLCAIRRKPESCEASPSWDGV
jgi:hypothetical protein